MLKATRQKIHSIPTEKRLSESTERVGSYADRSRRVPDPRLGALTTAAYPCPRVHRGVVKCVGRIKAGSPALILGAVFPGPEAEVALEKGTLGSVGAPRAPGPCL